MTIFKKSLPRRTFLQGAGASVALPFVKCHGPVADRTRPDGGSTAKARRFHLRAARHDHDRIGRLLDADDPLARTSSLSSTLKPLERFRDHVTIVSNLMGADGVGQHTGAPSAWLTDTYPKKTQGADIEAGTSIDQIIAGQIGQDTVFPSMQLAIEDVSSLVGTCDAGYACSYLNTVSYASPTEPLPEPGQSPYDFRANVRGHGHCRTAPRAHASEPQHSRFGLPRNRSASARRSVRRTAYVSATTSTTFAR